MRIRFNEISPTGNQYELQAIEGLDEQQDFVVQGPMEVRCSLKRKGDDKVELQGWLKATVALACDRCLEQYNLVLESEMQLLLETISEDSWHLREIEHVGDDLDTMILDESVVDLDDVLRQQLYLMLPVKSLCSETCRGVCPQCGANLNKEECSCATGDRTNPFAVLQQLKQFTTTKK